MTSALPGADSFSKRLNIFGVALIVVFLAGVLVLYAKPDSEHESFSGVFYVSETPFPCGPDLKQLCTTLEVSPPSGQVGLLWSPNWEKVSGAEGTAIGMGYQNTLDILAQAAFMESAATYAYAYVYDGKEDWYLPSKDELEELCKSFSSNRKDVAPVVDPNGNKSACIGSREPLAGFITSNYWSSSQNADSTAWTQHFTSGDQYSFYKLNAGYVRPIRAF